MWGTCEQRETVMNSLDTLMAEMLRKKFNREQLLFILLMHKLEEQGFRLNSEQLLNLKKQIVDQMADNESGKIVLNVEIDDDIEEDRRIDLTVTPSDYEVLKERVDEVSKKTILGVTSRLAEHLLREWKQQASSILKERRNYQQGFNERLWMIWGEALDLLDVLLGVSLEAGIDFNEKLRSKAYQGNDLVFDALTRLHARGCQIAREIHVLLSYGLADGAHARWRTLHEVSVIASFICKHGQAIAERYFLHTGIETYKSALQYQEHSATLGWSPLSEEEMEQVKTVYDSLILRYGKDFKVDYGWASTVLGKIRPTFHDIEQNAGIEHVRPLVKMANTNVHASAKGIAHRLGLPPETDILLAGPSIYGLGDPGRSTAYSLTLLTAVMLTYEPDMDRLVRVQAMQSLHLEIHDAFYQAEMKLDKDEE